MTIYNVIRTNDEGVISITSFPVIDEQLSGIALKEAEECFKKIVLETAPDYFAEYDDIDDFIEDQKFVGDGFVVQIVCSYIDY